MDNDPKTNKGLEALQERIDEQQKSVDTVYDEYKKEKARLEAMKESQAIMKEALDS